MKRERQGLPVTDRSIRAAIAELAPDLPMSSADSCLAWARRREVLGNEFTGGEAVVRHWLIYGHNETDSTATTNGELMAPLGPKGFDGSTPPPSPPLGALASADVADSPVNEPQGAERTAAPSGKMG